MASIIGMWVLAHQGGWDEVLMVLAPLVIFAGLLVVARRRAGDLETPGDGTRTADGSQDDRERTGPV